MSGSADAAPETSCDPEEDADEIARLSAAALWAGDRASQGLGMTIVHAGPGYATLAMEVTAAMTNGLDIAHGGFVFALADSAFGFACNSRGDKAVSQHCSITYLRPVRLGDRLVATAHEVALSARTGLYDVSVSAGDETVAEFRGQSRLIGGRWVAEGA